jgi:hypothetical protein
MTYLSTGRSLHEYTVALRISGERLDIDALTRQLRVQPTQIVKVGDVRRGSPSKKAIWSHEVFSQAGTSWTSLEDGLMALIAVFEPRKQAIELLQQEFEVFLWCGHFSSSFDGGPQLSPHAFKALASLGVTLYLDTYHVAASE